MHSIRFPVVGSPELKEETVVRERVKANKRGMAAFVLVAGLALLPTGAIAQNVSVDYDQQADLSGCATYAWVTGQPAENPLVHKNIMNAIDGALAGKGWTKVEDGACRSVSYQASAKEQKRLQVWQPGRFFGGMGSVDVESTVSGMLIVDIGDAATGQLLWRGVARDTVSDKPERNHAKLAKSVEKMFKDFPPAGRTK